MVRLYSSRMCSRFVVVVISVYVLVNRAWVVVEPDGEGTMMSCSVCIGRLEEGGRGEGRGAGGG